MEKAAIVSVLALCVIGFGSGFHVSYDDCGGADALSKLVFVDVDPCINQPDPCSLKKGTEETIQVQFVPKVNITSAKTVVHADLDRGVQIRGGSKSAVTPAPFPVDEPDACKGQGLDCPLLAGKTYTFKTHLPIKSMYPAIQVVVKWELHDQDDKVVYCWQIPARIVN
ncbi:NPC intracellular cholesterol transporter 2 [Pocillopora verrucosa]|uniref:NPC intracellular cholesterol transporter 2 n=1 Tax=Pocillopora verrucosa TaxID=203993 RepID=UPI00333F0B05